MTVPDHSRAEDLFLGGRPLEDATPELPARFAELMGQVVTIVGRFQRGEIGGTEAARRLAELRTYDETGTEWTVGASTLGWYCRRGTEPWQQSSPPTRAQPQRLGLAGDYDAFELLDDELLAALDDPRVGSSAPVPSPPADAPPDPAGDAPDAGAVRLDDDPTFPLHHPGVVPYVEPANSGVDGIHGHSAALRDDAPPGDPLGPTGGPGSPGVTDPGVTDPGVLDLELLLADAAPDAEGPDRRSTDAPDPGEPDPLDGLDAELARWLDEPGGGGYADAS